MLLGAPEVHVPAPAVELEPKAGPRIGPFPNVASPRPMAVSRILDGQNAMPVSIRSHAALGALLCAGQRPGIVPRHPPRSAIDTLPGGITAVASRRVITLPLR